MPNVQIHAFSAPCFPVAYHLSRSALMLVQAAGTGASAGAAGVSESDMSVFAGEASWVLSRPLNACGFQNPERQKESDEVRERERERENQRGDE